MQATGGLGRLVVVGAAIALVLGACSSEESVGDDAGNAPGEVDVAGEVVAAEDGGLRIAVLSPRADTVSGGDALLRVDGAADDLEVRLGESGVTAQFEPVGDGSFVGLVEGLGAGENTVVATSGDDEAEVVLTNHPATGPIFSGPHQEPFACTTEQHGLGPALDDDCSAETRVFWTYVDGDRAIRRLDDPSAVPDDVATADVDGGTVPFVIRNEIGTINRAVYWIHTLDLGSDPTAAPAPAWNRRLVYSFGGGCGTSFSQGEPLAESFGPDLGGPVQLALLERGYASATATLNTFQVACNDVLSAETLLMVKEHFIETYGVPELTIGEGASGGSIQQYLIAQNYPGLLDGIAAMLPFPDAISIAPGVSDCGLLADYYRSDSASDWTAEQRAAVNGHATDVTCGVWNESFGVGVEADAGCAIHEASGAVYDEEDNPDGVRCTLQDSNVNVYGTDPETGFARRPLDNVGVQYGLEALNERIIDVDQFLDLNEEIGGHDLDGAIVPERTRADEDTIAHAYEHGRVTLGEGDLRSIPIITLDLYSDPVGDIHDRFRAFQLVERLRDEDGERAPNFMVWTRDLAGDPRPDALVDAIRGQAGDVRMEIIETVDAWATALRADDSDRPLDVELEAARPDAAVDNCVSSAGERISALDVYEEPGPCRDEFPLAGDPRTAAGADLASTTLKCELRPVDPARYEVELTDEQLERLEAIFPDGVCDYSRPGIGETDLDGTWLRY